MCCIIFSELKKTQRKVFRQSSDCHAKHIFTQRLVSGFNFTTDFPENVISAQSLSTKYNYHARFFGNNFNKFLSEKNRREAFGVSSENMLHTTFWGFVSGGVKDALTFGLRLMFVDITEP